MESAERHRLISISRFVSTLGGAFRAFFIYKHDSKVIDEILDGVGKRFASVTANKEPLAFGVTNLSLTYKGNPVGYQDVTGYLASSLRLLGMKGFVLTPPIPNRLFFSFFNILSGKESNELKLNRLRAYMESDDEEVKPILLVPLTVNSIVLTLSDENIKGRLTVLRKPKEEGGPGFIEALATSQIATLPDLYSWICIKAEGLPKSLCSFVRALTDATREGFFPFERFIEVFPVPKELQTRFKQEVAIESFSRPRKETGLGHRFIPLPPRSRSPRPVVTYVSKFTQSEIETRHAARAQGMERSPLKDLELAQMLINASGANFIIGVRILLRLLQEKNTVATQEKALKLGIKIWTQSQHTVDDMALISLLSSLRQILTKPHNLSLILYPLRTLTMESDIFKRISNFIISLGETSFPALIQALEAEQERGMRRKLCHLITLIARDHGTDFLMETAQEASHFLLRNIIMILGDIKSAKAIEAIGTTIGHEKKIIRAEAVRSLIKIGDQNVIPILCHALETPLDLDLKRAIISFLSTRKERHAVDPLVHLAQDKSLPHHFRCELYRVIGHIGGFQAKQFLESQNKSSLLDAFSKEEKELHDLVKSLLEEMS